MITILSVLFIVLGISLVIATIKEGYDKTYIEKYNKIKFLINLVKGFSYAIMGLLVILKIISGRTLVNLVILFAGLSILIDYKIKT
ncbi:hypothetical protein QOZ84_02155 [Romboutsia sedimentorum]|uniref:DUF3784 domain-containing protein n=1 Tax=Romboutsia sedimentorum TaxID=1368474 RepID=A0ABT7E5Y3_9FIRM|nr:hypothetical protein [Romboutsia sedimentorum]MDK2562337.1 hypothetical protein [Romboutsia sedimentorum]